jgi:hypothetical protein
MAMRALVIASLLAAMSAAAAAQTAAPAPTQSTGANGEDINARRICRVTPVIGSRLGGTRTCKTKAEWDQFAREMRTTVERIQGMGAGCMMGTNEPGNTHLVCSN